MKGLVHWFTDNSVAANILLVIIVASGLLTLTTVQQEIFPELETGTITVSVIYPGATPAEVEESIAIKIEEELQGVDGIDRITSSSNEGAGAVTIEVESGADVRRVLDDVKTRVDAIDTFPGEAEKPVIQEVLLRRQVLNVAISGNTDELSLKRMGERVRDEITSLPEITQAELVNVRPYEISIEVSEEDLRRFGLTFDEVANAVRRSSLDLPGGSIEAAGGEILLRTKGQAYRGSDFEQIVLRTRADGTRLLLGDVAQVVDGFADTDQFARFDGKPSSMVKVYRVGEQDALSVADAVYRYVEDAQLRMPEGMELTVWDDTSVLLKGRRDLLVKNGITGLALVFLVLTIFLRLRLALWVSIGIPISFLGAIWLMPTLAVTINLISLFAFILVLGIVVDDAIVVGENIFTHHQRHGDGFRAAVEGTHEVAVPVTFGVLTTVAAFVPLTMVPGTFGQVWRVIPLIVIPVLAFSMIESKLILPAHLKHLRGKGGEWGWGRRVVVFVVGALAIVALYGMLRSRAGMVVPTLLTVAIPVLALILVLSRYQERYARWLERFVQTRYRPSLEFALRWRYLTVAVGIATFVVTMGLVAGGWIKFSFMPNVEADSITVRLQMPQGTPVAVTTEAIGRVERAAFELRDEIDGNRAPDRPSVFQHMLTSVGTQPSMTERRGPRGPAEGNFNGSHLAELKIELVGNEQRTISSEQISRQLRERVGPIPGTTSLTFSASLFGAGDAIDLQLASPDVNELEELAEKLKTALTQYQGVTDISDSYEEGKRELEMRITPEGQALGLTQLDLGRQVRAAFYGEEAQRIQRGRDEIKVMVRYPESQRRSQGDLENMRVRLPDGTDIPFFRVAQVEEGRGYASIRRVDRQRVISVTADIDEDLANANEVLASVTSEVLPVLLADHPTVTWSLEGEQAEQRESAQGIMRGFLLALLVIYSLMAIPFRSYVHPVVVMTAVPFGLVGAIWGHLIMGMNLSMLSAIGMVALTGVVVNDSLVMVDYINRRRREGKSMPEAVRMAGPARFRAILLTSLTTFAGLLPMLLERSLQARFLIPLAISLGFGVVFATFVTLMIVPSSYMILEDFLRLPRRLRERIRGFAPGEGEGAGTGAWLGEPHQGRSPRSVGARAVGSQRRPPA